MLKKIIKNIGILVLLFVVSCKQEQRAPSIYLIPHGYLGEVLIVYNHPDGEEELFENGKRVYKIPENGVLKTKFKASYGLVYDHYFYVDATQNRKEFFQIYQGENEEGICVYNMITSKMKFADGNTYELSGLMVSPEDSITNYNTFSYKELDLFVLYE